MAAAAVRSSKAIDVQYRMHKKSSGPAAEAGAGDTTVGVQKLEGRWSLQGKTERSNASGSLEMGSTEGPILQFGGTKLYLSPTPISCEQSYNQTRYSFEVTDACASSGVSEDISVGDHFDFETGDFGGQPELPGECDVTVKADGSIEGDASASPSCSCDDICYKFTGQRLTTPR